MCFSFILLFTLKGFDVVFFCLFFDVRVSVMFNLMFFHYTFSSVLVAVATFWEIAAHLF